MTLGTPGTAGNPPTHFTEPNDVLVAPNGSIFVAEAHNDQFLDPPGTGGVGRISKFAPDGKFIKSWGKWGYGPGEFRGAHSLAMDSKGRLFVADRGNRRIQIFDQEGKHLDTWYQFSRISGLYIDAKDVLYAIDSESDDAYNPGWRKGLRVGNAANGRSVVLRARARVQAGVGNGRLRIDGRRRRRGRAGECVRRRSRAHSGAHEVHPASSSGENWQTRRLGIRGCGGGCMFRHMPITRAVMAALGVAVVSGALVSGQGGEPQFKPHPSTQEPSRLVTLDKLKQWEKELSNWGRWGKDDQRGLLEPDHAGEDEARDVAGQGRQDRHASDQSDQENGQRHGRLRRERAPNGAHRSEDRRDPGRARHHPALDSRRPQLAPRRALPLPGSDRAEAGRAGGQLQRLPVHAHRCRLPGVGGRSHGPGLRHARPARRPARC